MFHGAASNVRTLTIRHQLQATIELCILNNSKIPLYLTVPPMRRWINCLTVSDSFQVQDT